MHALVAGVLSDAHTWSLVYIQLVLEEEGHDVTNLGACASPQRLVNACKRVIPDLIVISSVNGHGCSDALESIHAIRACSATAGVPAIIGGKLSVHGGIRMDVNHSLIEAGFDRVFESSATGDDIITYLKQLESLTKRHS